MPDMTALILEDSQTQAQIVTRLIAAQGWSTIHCLSVKEAIDTLKTVEVQALFLDVFIGSQNTLSSLSIFRQLAREAPLVVMTAGSDRESVEHTLESARQAKADYVLRKPFSEKHIKEIFGTAFKDTTTDRKKHVLVVEDSAPIRSLVRGSLEFGGYRVSTASSMEDAFKNVDIAHVDVVLCDVFMPGMGGLKGMRTIKKVWPKVPIIAMSAGVESFVSEADALNAARNLGADAQIRKPFTNDDLLEIVGLVSCQDMLID